MRSPVYFAYCRALRPQFSAWGGGISREDGHVIEAAAQPAQWQARIVSAGELLIGAFAVIGHNVYRLVPNEVPILVVLAIASMRWREGAWRWNALGFKRPGSWSRLVMIGLAAAATRVILGSFLIEPVTAYFWPPIKAPSQVNEIRGHFTAVLTYLPLVWVFAGFGEEIGYRGYLLNKLADVFGRTRAADVVAILGSALLFGYGHYYKGPAGILDSGMAGVILGAAYYVSGKNLWTCVLTHGLIDTFGLLAAYAGWDN
jgi:membrane protease YdiL (CAAX protease family)